MSPSIQESQNTRNQTTNEAARQTANRVAHSAADATQECASYYVGQPAKDLFSLAKDYAHDKPDIAAFWCFGLGVLVGWKLKP
ncbi:hypothetical protein EC9_28200 [Rosistilla ulvae]|uniref:Uncharacterized protein n=1 Tax=Rosistilla ulvae TaxID=1930277 RepID=A0A517M1D6_9BACT|nr:hypothetical protein [Rosistilla ulvae]QDS88629.1 hypothetical protein EC9_28200 [Rosistilla ulvae]